MRIHDGCCFYLSLRYLRCSLQVVYSSLPLFFCTPCFVCMTLLLLSSPSFLFALDVSHPLLFFVAGRFDLVPYTFTTPFGRFPAGYAFVPFTTYHVDLLRYTVGVFALLVYPVGGLFAQHLHRRDGLSSVAGRRYAVAYMHLHCCCGPRSPLHSPVLLVGWLLPVPVSGRHGLPLPTCWLFAVR
jgi:hypothetical protein